jgi:hypothetical protein
MMLDLLAHGARFTNIASGPFDEVDEGQAALLCRLQAEMMLL